ncbi:unnamed protein product [Arctia plantaginis]|uniref:Fucosyltransferase n=1 Tax=Arctia plantaginis TaxID=874455 RepID=A0A8S0YXI0_ARCPL|nr:unnamed protein product [Arctia plantaginis]
MWSQLNFNPQRTPEVLVLRKPEKKAEHVTVKPRLKYILLWTLKTRDPVKYLGTGKNTFINRKCSSVECYVSTDRNFLKNVTKFDVIVFHSSDIRDFDLPTSRSPHQKYVFASMESADYYPFCNTMYNDFFNWTWTYKLNSDEQYSYITITDTNGTIVGPREFMHWKQIEDMDPIDNVLKNKLSRKKIAAAWFVSNCHSHSKRELLAIDLMAELQKYNLILDIYGQCGSKTCPRSDMSKCWQLLEQDYYFYLSFENSFSPDYVTEKLLHALQHYTIPIVFGGANYTRFMPDGIYLDATKLTVPELAKKMADIINNKEEYYNYFKWHNHYSYHDSTDFSESDPYCNFCSMVDDEQRFEEKSVYDDFCTWWSTPTRCRV